jgi:hypothetical protein
MRPFTADHTVGRAVCWNVTDPIKAVVENGSKVQKSRTVVITTARDSLSSRR